MTTILSKLTFNYYIFKRMCKLLPRKNKKISMLYIDYNPLPESSSHVELKYRFRNAVWFAANDKKTLSNRLVVPKPEANEEIKLTVHGVFTSQVYKFRLMHDHVLVVR